MSDIKINRDTFFDLCSLLDNFLNDLDYNTMDKYQKSQIDTLRAYILIRDYKGSREDEKTIYEHLLKTRKSNSKENIKKAEDLYSQIKEYRQQIKKSLDEKNIKI